MKPYSSASKSIITALLLFNPGWAFAQTPTTSSEASPSSGTASVKVEIEPSLIVMSARGASLQGQTLTLTASRPQDNQAVASAKISN